WFLKASLSAPIPLGRAPLRLRRWVLDPLLRAARAVERAEPLRHDSLAAELAGPREYDVAIADVVRVERDACDGLRSSPASLARLDRKPAEILAVEFEQVEGAERGRV